MCTEKSKKLVDKSKENQNSESSDNVSNCGDKIEIPVAKKTGDGLRIYNKYHCCFFCEKIVKLKIARHMRSVHKKEYEIYLAKQDFDEKTAVELLKNKGNYFHNVRIINEKIGELIVVGRPTMKVSYKNYLLCPKCL